MALALITIGAILLIAATRNTQGELFDTLKGDFTGPNNFIYWVLAIVAVGAIGYVPKLKPLSNAFLLLVIAVILLHNRGFFAQFQQQIAATQKGSTQENG